MVRELIGVDCACDPRSVGLARGYFDGRRTRVAQVLLGSKLQRPAAIVAQWIMEASGPVLLAIDAPLGWPAPLAQALHAHAAGDSLAPDAHSLFRRSTDVLVKEHVGQQPLDVGADRIARTAYEAPGLLRDLRTHLSQPLLLAWAPDYSESSVIEVYPAATLRVHGFSPQGYKGTNDEAVRRAYVERLTEIVSIDCERTLLIGNANAFDALVCLIAAQDFLRGICYTPVDPSIANREGWIWGFEVGTP